MDTQHNEVSIDIVIIKIQPTEWNARKMSLNSQNQQRDSTVIANQVPVWARWQQTAEARRQMWYKINFLVFNLKHSGAADVPNLRKFKWYAPSSNIDLWRINLNFMYRTS